MKRTQIQLDENTWEALRERAFKEKSSVAALIRGFLQSQVVPAKKKKKLSMKDFTFIGIGKSRGKGSGKISVDHDEELAKAFAE